jgi:hypothetical protein
MSSRDFPGAVTRKASDFYAGSYTDLLDVCKSNRNIVDEDR